MAGPSAYACVHTRHTHAGSGENKDAAVTFQLQTSPSCLFCGSFVCLSGPSLITLDFFLLSAAAEAAGPGVLVLVKRARSSTGKDLRGVSYARESRPDRFPDAEPRRSSACDATPRGGETVWRWSGRLIKLRRSALVFMRFSLPFCVRVRARARVCVCVRGPAEITRRGERARNEGRREEQHETHALKTQRGEHWIRFNMPRSFYGRGADPDDYTHRTRVGGEQGGGGGGGGGVLSTGSRPRCLLFRCLL